MNVNDMKVTKDGKEQPIATVAEIESKEALQSKIMQSIKYKLDYIKNAERELESAKKNLETKKETLKKFLEMDVYEAARTC